MMERGSEFDVVELFVCEVWRIKLGVGSGEWHSWSFGCVCWMWL
jgi:hypothetical protein